MTSKKKLNLIIVGDANSIFIKEYIEFVCAKSDYKIYIISTRNTHYKDFYEQNKVTVITLSDLKQSNRFKRVLFGSVKAFKKINAISSIDIVHIHYIDVFIICLLMNLIFRAKNLILSYWSSLLTLNWMDNIIIYPFLCKARHITFVTEEARDRFNSIYKSKELLAKTKVIDFGISHYNNIDKVSYTLTKDKCKELFKIDKKLICIHVGYNGAEQQQHLAIMRKLVTIPSEILSQLYFVFHFGYGVHSDEYRNSIISLMRDKNIKYEIIDKYMYADEIAVFRKTADIFIYGQSRDALSSSMCEYLYAGVLMLKGKWLKSKILTDYHIFFKEYATFDDLPTIFVKEITSISMYSDELCENRAKLRHINSWDRYASEWRKLYC